MFKYIYQSIFNKRNNSCLYRNIVRLSESEREEYLNFWSQKQLLSIDEFIFLYFGIEIPNNSEGSYRKIDFDLVKSHPKYNEIFVFRKLIRNHIESVFFETSNKQYLLSEVNKNLKKKKTVKSSKKIEPVVSVYSPDWIDLSTLFRTLNYTNFFISS